MFLKDKLTELRKNAGYTQQEIAELIGVERSTYTCYETGKAKIPLNKIQLLAIIYNVDLNAFSTADVLVLKSKESESGQQGGAALTKAERVYLAKIRLLHAMGKEEELNKALEKLVEEE